MPLTCGRTSATRNGDVRPGSSVVRETGCVAKVTTVTCGLPAWGASCFLPQAARVRADAVSAKTAAPRHIALFLFIDCIPDFNKGSPAPRKRRVPVGPEGAGLPGAILRRTSARQTVLARSAAFDLGGFAWNTQGWTFIALLHCRTRILSYPALETKGHEEKTSFHLWDNCPIRTVTKFGHETPTGNGTLRRGRQDKQF